MSDRPKEEISEGVFVDVDPESVIKSQAAEITRLRAALADAQARVMKLETRLEITYCSVFRDGELVRKEIPPEERDSFPDGIRCRDATIGLLEEDLAEKNKTIENMRLVTDQYRKNSNEQFERANRAEDAQAVGFAAGVEAAARKADAGELSLIDVECATAIRALATPNDKIISENQKT